jgi:sugar lactone lactonase YvrE
VISVAVPADATYLGGQTLDFTVNLTETVIVTGTPALELTLDAGVRNAAYLSGSGSSNLVFRYTVQAGDNDTNGIVCASSVSLDSGTIQDAAGNDALLTFDTPSPTGVLVDTMAPAITSIIRLTPSDQVISGNAVVFQVTFSKAVMELGMNTFVVTPINNSTVAGIVTAVSGGPIVYEVEVTITAGWGDFRLDGVGPSIAFLYASGFNSPNALAFQRWGDLYVANGGDNTVSQVRYDGEVSTFAINLNQPTALATDRYGDLYVANGGDDTVGQVRYDGEVSPFASGFNQPRALAFDDDRNLYVANYGDGSVSKVNDSGDTSTFTTGLDGADSLAFDSSWNLYVGSSTNNLVTRVTSDGITNTFAIGFNQPRALAFDDVGNLFVANYGNGTVSRVTTNGVVTVFAEGFTAPIGLAFDRNSGLYVADQTNGTITRLTPVWINDLAGNAFPGPSFTSGENYTLATTNPTDITLSSSFVNQSSGTNATVGMLTTTDSDSGDIHTYTLVHGTGDTDNGFFSIATNALLVDSSALLAGAYSVRIQTDDGNGGFYEEAFVITVVDDVAPTVVSIVRYSPSGSNIVSGFATWRVTFSEPVTGVELGDFTLTQLGGNGVVFGTSVSGGPSVYDVTVEYIAGVSPMRLDLNALETGIADGATNAISGGYTNSEIYNFDNDGPAVDWVDVPADGNYRAGKSLDVTIHYFENTTVTGTPSIGLAIGSTARSAGYASGSGTRDIVFRYTVQDGDSDTDGIDLESIVALNGGTLQDAAGNNAALEFEHSPTIGVLVDGVAPQIASIIRKTPLEQVVATNSTVFEVTFTKDMIGIGVGSFKVTPTNDSTAIGVVASVSGGPKVFDVTVNVISGAGEFQLVAVDFSVTAFATGLTNPAGLAFDSTGNLYVSSFESDTQTGTVSRVTSDGSISLFATDVHSPFALAFDHAGNLFVSSLNAGIVSQVTSDGTVSVFSTNFLQPAGLAFDSAGDLYVADLESGTVSKVTTNGTVSVFATNLFYPTSLAFDRAGDLYVSQLFGGGIIKMTTNGTASVFATNIPFALALAFDPAGDLYVSQFATGGILKVTTNGMVSVVAVEVAQYFGLAFDSVGQLYLANPATGFITKVTGQPSTDLAGNSTIGLPYASDETYIYKPNGVPTDLALSSSSVNESSSTNATVGTLTTTDADSGDGHTYALVSGAGDANNALFVIEGDVLKVGTNTLVAGDYSVRIQTDDRNGGTYAEAFNIRVADDVSPAITGVAVPANAIYRAGQNLDFTVSFSELVSVTSTPMLSLTIGSTPVSAEYIFGNGSSNLLFRYTVQNGDNDTDGIVLISPLALNGGTIKDAAENNAMLNFTAPTTTGVLVDALAPQIISITRKTPGQQTVLTNTMIFTVTFSENVAGVSPARFAVTPVNGSTVAGTISSVSGGPTIYDVTVTITAGTGEFRLDVPNIQIPN